MKVLFVDDEKSFVDQAKLFLEKLDSDLNIEPVTSGEEALEKLDEDQYDVIVSDYQMPNMDGLDLLEEVREKRESEVPFIVFTGRGREEVAIKALNLGADRYLQKRGDPKSQYGVLADAIRQEYDHHESERKYRTVVKNSNDAIYIFREDRFLFVNERATEMSGYSKEGLYEMDILELLHEEDREKLIDFAEKKARGEETPSRYEARIITKGGEIKHLQLSMTTIGYRGEEAFLGSARDITELKRLQEERETYIDELQFMQETVVEVSRMERIDEICEYIAEEIHSLNPDSLVGISLYDDEKRKITLRSFVGMEDFQGVLGEFISEDLVTMPIDPEDIGSRSKLYTSGKFEEIPDGLYGLFEEKIPEEMCQDIEDLLGVEEVLTVGFALDEEPYGGIILLKGEEEIKHKDAIETLASHLSVVLHRKQAEKRLRLSDFSLDQASLEIYWITPEGRFIFANKEVSERLGYSKEELKGMHVWDVDPKYEEEMRRERWEKLKEEKVLTFESEHETKDGEIYPVEITSNYLKFDGREYEFAFAEDITERKRKEKELREERNFIEQIAETSPVCITKVDKNGDITYANDKAEDILGLSKSDIKGRTYDDPDWKITDFEGRDFPTENLPFEQLKEKGEAVYDVRHAIEWPDGERKLLSINAAPLYDEEGNFDGMVAAIEDVTEKVKKERELKESRRRLKTIMGNIPGIAYRCLNERDWTMRFISKGCYEMTGYDVEELTGDEGVSYADLIYSEDRERIWEEVQEAIESDEPFEIEYRIETSTGDEKWVWEKGRAVGSEEEKEVIEGIITDITERKETELDLRQKERAIQNSINGIAIADLDGTVRSVNESLVDMFGYDTERDILGENTLKFFYDEEEASKAIDVLLDEGEWQGELKGVKENGDLLTVYLSANLILDQDGDPTGLLGTMIDITERKEMEEKLKQRMSAIESSIDGIAILDEDETFTYLNERHAKIYGYNSPEELIGETWKVLYDDEELKRFENEIMPMFREMGKWRGEAVGMKKDGSKFPQELSLTALEDGGLICLVRDITQRKEAEKELDEVRERYNALFERSMDAVYIHDMKGNILDVNQAALEMLGYEREDIDDLDFTDLLPEDQIDRALGILDEIMETGTQDELTTFEVKTKGGERVLVETKASLIYKEGEPYAVLGIGRDITDRMETLETLKEKNKEIESMLDSMMNAFVLFESVFDEDGNFVSYRFIYINEAYEEMTGVTLEEVKGKTVHEVWPETDDEWVERYGEVAVTGESQTFDLYHGPTDKTYHCNVYRPYDTKEKFCVIFEDISEKEEREQKLRKERKKFQEIFNNVNDAIYLHEVTSEGMPGDFIEVNDTAVEMLGYSREEFLEMLPEKIDAAEKAEEVPEVMKELVEKGESRFEMVHKAKDGTKIPVEIHSHMVEFEGEKRVLSVVRDISERKEAEERLKSSERKFRSSFEASPDPTFLLDKEGVFQDVNEAALEKLGYDKEEIVGKKLQEQPFLTEEGVERTVDRFKRRKQGEEIPPYEVEMVSKDGDKLYAEVNAATFEGDVFEGEIVIGRDITEKREAKEEREELLHDLRERYKELNCLYTITRLGTDPSNSMDDILEGALEVIPQSWQYPDIAAAKVVLEGREYLTDDFEETDWCLSSPIEVGDEKIGEITICYTEEKHDVDGDPFLEEEKDLIDAISTVISGVIQKKRSERRLEESEERYRALVETAFAGIGITDFENVLTYVNDQFADMLGYPKEDLIGKSLAEISPDEEMTKFEEEIERREKGETSRYETTLEKKNGEKIDAMVHASPFKNAAGDFVGTMGVVTDITDKKRTREREELLHTLLRHDVKNKAQVVRGYLQLLEEDEEIPEEEKEPLAKAIKANKEGINLMQKIRLLLSAQEEEIRPVNIATTIHEAVDDTEALVKDNDMEIYLECPSMECEVQGGTLLKEVFSNIIENSVYHSEGEKIRVSGEIREDEIICSIEDDGKGIPDEKKERIFDRGYTTDEERGTGLGMFLVKMLLETYGGSIEVKDSDMGGARFEIHLNKVK